MAKNKGTAFEREIELACDAYRRKRIAKIEKADAPTKVIGKKVIHLENPYPDFIGAWTSQGGRFLGFEAKRTDKSVLAVGLSGLKTSQLNQLEEWSRAGGFTALLWQYRQEVRAMTPAMIRSALAASGRKSLLFEQAEKLPKGMGFVQFDFLRWANDLTK